MGIFHFFNLECYFLKYKTFFRFSVSWNIRKFHFLKHKIYFRGFHFVKTLEVFLGWTFFIFLSLGWKVQGSISGSMRNFLILESECYVSWNIRNFFQGWIYFNFLSLESKVQSSTSRNIRKAFFWENIRNFLMLEVESFISRNMKNFFRGGFFLISRVWV